MRVKGGFDQEAEKQRSREEQSGWEDFWSDLGRQDVILAMQLPGGPIISTDRIVVVERCWCSEEGLEQLELITE